MWNDATESKPKPGSWVFVWNRGLGGYSVAKWCKDRWLSSGAFGNRKQDITHWMDPGPPTGESRGGNACRAQRTTRDSQNG